MSKEAPTTNHQSAIKSWKEKQQSKENRKRKKDNKNDDPNNKRQKQHQQQTADEVDPQLRKKQLAPIRKNLPVYRFRKQIIQLVKNHDTVLVVAETGSGKSTQIPGYLHEDGILSKQSSTDNKKGKKKKKKSLICVVQPRRVAAITVARRVSQELGCRHGTVVGHRVRFDDCTDRKRTRIVYMTDGMLLREATIDPLLSNYGIIVLDEAHERSLQTDVLFGVVKRAMKARRKEQQQNNNNNDDDDATTEGTDNNSKPKNASSEEEQKESRDDVVRRRMSERAEELELSKLRVVVMSATLDVETFESFFAQPQTIRIPGRQFPVQILYTADPQEDYMDAALRTVLQIHEEGEKGDILVFLPGQEEIEDLASIIKKELEEIQETSAENALNNNNDNRPNIPKDIVQSIRGIGKNLHTITTNSGPSLVGDVMVCVLYAALPPEAQMSAFQPKPEGCRRKIILSTNIAETSVTLDGIRYVVDCGKHKTRDYSGATGMESLILRDVSKAQAAQRTGRAGRVSAGYCFRLYTEDAYDALDENAKPEILRANLAQVVLQLKGMGVHDPRKFDFLTPPSEQTLIKAFELLYALGAIDATMELTDYGKKLAKLPLDPTFGHLLLQSSKFECTSDILTVVSMLSAENIYYRQRENGAALARFASHEGDLPTLLTIYNSWQAEASYTNSKKTKNKFRIPHSEWCVRNCINGRALARAFDVRKQLKEICRNSLGLDVDSSSVDRENFHRAVCAGLFLQVATRIVSSAEINSSSSGRISSSTRGLYKTKIGGKEVSIHPTSAMFGRNPAPKTVVYTELLTTKKTYIRGVTQIREDWLMEVAPNFFQKH